MCVRVRVYVCVAVHACVIVHLCGWVLQEHITKVIFIEIQLIFATQ